MVFGKQRERSEEGGFGTLGIILFEKGIDTRQYPTWFKAVGRWPSDNTKMEEKLAPSECWACAPNNSPTMAPISIHEIEEETLEMGIPDKSQNANHYYVEVDKGDAPSYWNAVDLTPAEEEEDFIPSTQLGDAQVILDDLVFSTPPQISHVSRFLTLPELP